MIRTAIAVLALVALASNAEARQRHRVAAPICDNIDTMRPCAYQPNWLAGVREIRVMMRRERRAKTGGAVTSRRVAPAHRPESRSIAASPLSYSIARPLRYIAGRLICAINVNAALAERGIRGTGSALAHSFDRWGIRVAGPVPGAVAVTDRRGGGHVAIVSRVEGSRVWVFNPGRRGWREVEYTKRHARYRVAGS